jgi:two-component system nitrogen regulation sensor histidine kinase NtrY
MRLRTRLTLLFSLFSIVLVSLATAITYWLASSALVAELDGQSDRAAQRAEAYVEHRGADAAGVVRALSREPALRAALAQVASGAEEPRSPRIVGLAEDSAEGTDLDVFEILDSNGIVLSSAHWKANYGNPHVEAVRLAGSTGGAPVAARINVRGRTRIALVSAIPMEVGGMKFIALGGYYMDARPLRELEELLDVAVALVPLPSSAGASGAGAGAVPEGVAGAAAPSADGSGPGGDSARGGAAAAAGASMEGASLSARTHVLREVILPHSGGPPVAKLVVGVSRGRLKELAHGLRGAFVYAAAAALAFSWIVALVLARGITRPLERLTAGARVVASGDLTAVVEGEGSDEIGQLVKSFNRMVADLRASRTRISRMERIAAWREVARRIAHEIKNALSPIQLSIENVERSHRKGSGDFEAVLSRATGTVREEVDGLRLLVDEFTQFARMPPPELARDDVRKVVQRVVNLHESSRPGVFVSLETPPDPIDAMIDAGQLSRALGNIVANAIEASAEGGRVSVSVARAERDCPGGTPCVKIVVRDNGQGLTPEQREQVFEPYYTTKERGTGLGLAIAMKIINDHEGTIEVESEPGRGCAFAILLPAEAGLPEGGARER